jgi:transcriptional regulator with XRE-family HTH domain
MTITNEETISPLGSTAEASASRRCARSAAYREQHDRLAPYRAIAEAVILARGAHNLTQRELGQAIGTTDTAISRIESGRHPVTLGTLAKLGQALDLTFMVGSADAAKQAARDTRCVVVPETAIERTETRPVVVTPVGRAPTYAPIAMPTYAFGDTLGARPLAARKTR